VLILCSGNQYLEHTKHRGGGEDHRIPEKHRRIAIDDQRESVAAMNLFLCHRS
jgi:hypothetical protein